MFEWINMICLPSGMTTVKSTLIKKELKVSWRHFWKGMTEQPWVFHSEKKLVTLFKISCRVPPFKGARKYSFLWEHTRGLPVWVTGVFYDNFLRAKQVCLGLYFCPGKWCWQRVVVNRHLVRLVKKEPPWPVGEVSLHVWSTLNQPWQMKEEELCWPALTTSGCPPSVRASGLLWWDVALPCRLGMNPHFGD